MESTPELCKELLYQALREPIGVLVQVSDFARARQALYRARADANDTELNQLQFRLSPGLAGGNLIIVKEKVRVDEPEPQPLADQSLDDL